MLILLWLALVTHGAPSAHHHALILQTEKGGPNPPWELLLKQLARAETTYEWDSHHQKFDHTTPLAGGGEKCLMKEVERAMAAAANGARSHLDVVIEGHGYQEGFATDLEPWVSHDDFAKELFQILKGAQKRGLGNEFSLRLYLGTCFAGGASVSLAKLPTADLPFGITVVAGCGADEATCRLHLYGSVAQTTKYLGASRECPTRFYSEGNFEQEFVRVAETLGKADFRFPEPRQQQTKLKTGLARIDLFGANAAAASGIDRPELQPEFVEAFAKILLRAIRRSPSEFGDIEKLSFAGDNFEFYDALSRAAAQSADPELAQTIKLFVLPASAVRSRGDLVPDWWFQEMRTLVSSPFAHIRRPARKYIQFLYETLERESAWSRCEELLKMSEE